MISDHKTRKFSDREKDIFHLGVMEGERRVQYRLALLETTNRRLWEQLCELDEVEPLVDVRMTMSEARQIVGAMVRYRNTVQGKGARTRRKAVHWLRQKIALSEEIEMDLLQKIKKPAE